MTVSICSSCSEYHRLPVIHSSIHLSIGLFILLKFPNISIQPHINHYGLSYLLIYTIIYFFNKPSLHQSTHSSFCLSIHLSIHPSIHPSIRFIHFIHKFIFFFHFCMFFFSYLKLSSVRFQRRAFSIDVVMWHYELIQLHSFNRSWKQRDGVNWERKYSQRLWSSQKTS